MVPVGGGVAVVFASLGDFAVRENGEGSAAAARVSRIFRDEEESGRALLWKQPDLRSQKEVAR